MDQAIVKIIVFMKKSYPQKSIFGLLANIRAFIKVVILKNTEILEYLFILIQALNRWWGVLYVGRSEMKLGVSEFKAILSLMTWQWSQMAI